MKLLRIIGLGLLALGPAIFCGCEDKLLYQAYYANAMKMVPRYAKDGDLIFRAGAEMDTVQLANRYDKRFSHVGIVEMAADGVYVINADSADDEGSGKVSRETLAVFLRNAHRYGLYRLKNNPARASGFPEAAKKYLDVPFDDTLNYQDPSTIYCCELVYLVLKEFCPEIKLNKVDFFSYIIIPVDALLDPRYFVHVKTGPAAAE